jgi:predicted DNA-binding transcriptional regulator AlpA
MTSDVRVPRLLRVRDLEAQTGIEKWRWYELFARGDGPEHIRIGLTIRVTDAALVRWLTEREAQSKQEGVS